MRAEPDGLTSLISAMMTSGEAYGLQLRSRDAHLPHIGPLDDYGHYALVPVEHVGHVVLRWLDGRAVPRDGGGSGIGRADCAGELPVVLPGIPLSWQTILEQRPIP